MQVATRYRCQTCRTDSFLPERPLDPTPRVRAGCAQCETIRTLTPVGSPGGRR